MALPGFWSLSAQAQPLIREIKSLHALLDPFCDYENDLENDSLLVECAVPGTDDGILDEIFSRLVDHEGKLRKLELQTWFRGKEDGRDAILSIRAGAGGVDAMDWAEKLERMYWRWLTRSGYEAEIVDRLKGEEAGIHRSMMEVRGPFAFGRLKSEQGVHRVCHISEFDAEKKKQTSFAAVEVIPVYPEVEIRVQEIDIETDTMRSGGPGGQGVQTTDSAVRVRHIPSGIMVKCQSQRSQIQNKRTALEILAAKLRELEEEKRSGRKGPKLEASFGHQTRTYVLEPYTLVKDHRTQYETGNVEKVLDGDLDGFVEAFLKWRKAE